MVNSFIFVLEILCALTIIFRAIWISAFIDWKYYSDYPLQYFGNVAGFSFLTCGAIGILFDHKSGFLFLLLGITFQLLSEPRRIK